MAKTESLGYYPFDDFFNYVAEKRKNNEVVPCIWERTYSILGDRIHYMVYMQEKDLNHSNNTCNVIDCLVGSISTLGLRIAGMLRALIPYCKYPEIGKKILVSDVISPLQIPNIITIDNDKSYMLQDERYIAGIVDEGETIHLYFFKKEKK